MGYKVRTKKDTMAYINGLSDKLKGAFYFERWHGANAGQIYLIANMDTGEQRTIMRVSKRIFEWVQLEQMPSQFCNVSLWKFALTEQRTPPNPVK